MNKWIVSKKISLNILKESWPLIIAGVASIINTRIDQIYIGSMLSSSVLGNYSAAAKISEFWLVLPTILNIVFYPILINLRSLNYNKYKRFLGSVIICCFCFGIIFSFIIFGMKEFSTVFLLSSFNIEKELALAAALIYLFLEYLVIITLYLVLNFNKINFLKKK